MFDKNGFALKDCRVKVYNFSADEREFISATMEHTVKGSGIPANATLAVPLDDQEGFTQVFNGESWEYVEDHRYSDVYNIQTKQKEDIRYIGELKEEHTLLAPPSQDHEFIGGEWILTEEKKQEIAEREREAERAKLQAERAKLMQEMQHHMLLGEEDKAREIALKIKELDA